jgi:hypothetical protein
MDDGANGAFTEVDPLIVNNQPSLRSYSISFIAAQTSLTFRFYLRAHNAIGYAETSIVSFVLAAKPEKPTNPPYLNLASTRAYQIHVDYDPLLVADNGGSDILSYELQIYNVTTSSW